MNLTKNEQIKQELELFRSQIKKLNETEERYQESLQEVTRESKKYKLEIRKLNDSYYKLLKLLIDKSIESLSNFNDVALYLAKEDKK